jgi:hypothetical protein
MASAELGILVDAASANAGDDRMFALTVFCPDKRTMSTSRKGPSSRSSIDLQELREQEVLRANRELAAYFKGRRTEREARAALKIVKAFIRDREHTDPAKRRPLPGATARAQKRAPARKTSGTRRRKRVPLTEAAATPSAPSSAPND